ncbi:SUMF1/EgtB/PvdO family nonheme iron enzyme [Marivirga sp.]|uniref:formylglycine-generating enzyme family protein n=1 Tax=Marivirga sp. TaxID=2018662 RepID=UPI0026003EF6|nr:SUMF1/EgtB/PvdO family nonheme iron enzyme [Marivirga sp.]
MNAHPAPKKIKNYYVDKTEILNIHYLEFIRHKEIELDSIEMKRFIPDGLKSLPLSKENWYKPLVMVSYEQAIAYCEWRSKVVSKKLNKKVTYRLPTPTEWGEIAAYLYDHKQVKKDIRKAKRKLAWHKVIPIVLESKDREAKNTNRIFNMFDNASEMTSEKGIAIGLNNNLSSILI